MDPREWWRTRLLEQPGAVEEEPFGPGVWVYKLRGKMFALLTQAGSPRLSLKCDPARAQALRAAFGAILPGYHLNKEHWNTLQVAELPGELVQDLLEHSHALVLAGLPRKARAALELEGHGR